MKLAVGRNKTLTLNLSELSSHLLAGIVTFLIDCFLSSREPLKLTL